MSDCERIAQVTHDKWATVRDLLRSLMINEQMSNSLNNFWLKKSKILFFSMFYVGVSSSFLMSDVSESLRLLTKMSDVSKLLRLLTKNEQPWAIYSDPSPKMSNHERIAQVTHQKWANCSLFWAIFSQKMNASLRKLMSEFPVLRIGDNLH